jgi:hypothetical protein
MDLIPEDAQWALLIVEDLSWQDYVSQEIT